MSHPNEGIELHINLPSEIPVMTLLGEVLFPHAIMPLRIFEDRYRSMLRDVLNSECMFAVAALDEKLAQEPGRFEPLRRTATVGVIRACQKKSDGTSNLVLQGLHRVYVETIVHEDPYRLIRVRPLESESGPEPEKLRQLRDNLFTLIESKNRLGGKIPKELLDYLSKIRDPEAFIDLAAHILCSDPRTKQNLLETLNTSQRYSIFLNVMRREIDLLNLDNLFRGSLGSDDPIPN